MTNSFSVHGLKTPILKEGDDLVGVLQESLKNTDAGTFADNDILVIAEAPLATTEGRIVKISETSPSEKAEELACKYHIDPRLAEIVLEESDEVVGGVLGYLLARRENMFLPNAGID
ncbi:MAG TPA: coenzyme F420-0:L-glutamate ligase [Methanocorpusculum sp.]|nr:coenzyme F420-0:L-glutamate ligase [Methanocorpusculum sp.]